MNSIGQRIAVALLCVACLQGAMAAWDIGFTGGLKALANKWTTNVPTQLGGGNDGLFNLQFRTGTEAAWIPFAIIRLADLRQRIPYARLQGVHHRTWAQRGRPER